MRRTTLSTFWFHRVCESVIFVSLIIGLSYFLPYLAPSSSLIQGLLVSPISAIYACALLTLSIGSYVLSPKRFLFELALSQYILLFGLVTVLIYQTGGMASPFIALWMLIAIFASVFRIFGQMTVGAFALGYLGIVLSNAPQFPNETILTTLIITVLPLIASYILFHSKGKKETSAEDVYSALASELHQVSSKSDVVIQAINEGVLALNPKGTIELINPAAQHIIGWTGGDAIGLDYKSVLKLFDKQDRPVEPSSDPILKTLTTNQDETTKNLLLSTSSNKRRHISLVVSPIGQVGQGVIVVFRDITSEQAEEREQAEFISTASHEMRTPVASIEGYLGLALNPATAQIDNKARDYLTKAHESAQHLGRLFQDLLDVTKADDGRLVNHPVIVDVVAFVGEIVESMRTKADEKGLRMFYKAGGDNGSSNPNARILAPVYYVNVDQDHLRQIITNLVENAIKYTLHGDVIIDVGGDEARVKITVQDSGIGIPAEDIPHLFQKFYRVDNSATREIGGTGLGLYICRRMAESMGGRLWAESEFQKGSSFYLELARVEQQDALHMIEEATNKTSIEPINLSPKLEQRQIEPMPQSQQEPSVISQAPATESQPTIASIEANPERYISRRPEQSGFSVPNRPQ